MKKINDIGKEQFQHILNVLNHYHNRNVEVKNDLILFRESITTANTIDFVLELEKLGEYEYKVSVTMNNRTESWIHIDGIAEEKIKLENNTEHPIHSIVSLTDIYDYHCIRDSRMRI